MSTSWTRPDFAKSIKEKYPVYKDWDDSQLVDAMIEKYPAYKDQVESPKQAVARVLPSPTGNASVSSFGKALQASTASQMFQQGQTLAHLKETDPTAYAQQAQDYVNSTKPLGRRTTAVKAGSTSALLDLINWGKGLAHLGIEGGDESPEVQQRLDAIRTATHKGATPSIYKDTTLSKETSTPERQLLSYLNQPNVQAALSNPSTIEWLLNKAPQLGSMMARLSAEGALTGPAAPFLDTFFSTYQQPVEQRLKQQALVAATMGLGKAGQKVLGKAIPGTDLISRGAKNIATRTTMAGSMAGLTGLTGGSADQAKEQALFGFSMSPGKSKGPEAIPEAPPRPIRGLLGEAPPEATASPSATLTTRGGSVTAQTPRESTALITTQFPTQPYGSRTQNTEAGPITTAKGETSFGGLGVRAVPLSVAKDFRIQLGNFMAEDVFHTLHPIEQAELSRLYSQTEANINRAQTEQPTSTSTALGKRGAIPEATIPLPTNLQIGGNTVGVEHFKQVIRTHLESGEQSLVGPPMTQPLTLQSFGGHYEAPTSEPLRAGLGAERGVESGLPAGQMRVPFPTAAEHLKALEKMTYAVGKNGPLTTPDGLPVLKKGFKAKNSYEQEMILAEINRLRVEIPKPIQDAARAKGGKVKVAEDPNAPLPEPGGSFLVNPKGVPNAPQPSGPSGGPNQGVPPGPNIPSNEGQVRQNTSGPPSSSGGAQQAGPQVPTPEAPISQGPLKGEPNAPTPTSQYAPPEGPPGNRNPSGSDLQSPSAQVHQTVEPPVPSSGPGGAASQSPASQSPIATPEALSGQGEVGGYDPSWPISKLSEAQRRAALELKFGVSDAGTLSEPDAKFLLSHNIDREALADIAMKARAGRITGYEWDPSKTPRENALAAAKVQGGPSFKGQKGEIDPDLLDAPWRIAKKVAEFVGGAKAAPKPETASALPAPGAATPFNDMSRVETITSNFKTANKVLHNHPETEALISAMERSQDKKIAWIGTSLRNLSAANHGINSLTGLSGLQGARLAGELATTQEPATMQAQLGQLSPKFKIPYTQASIDAALGWAKFREEVHALFPPKAGPAGKNVGYIPRYLTQMESLIGDTDLARGIHQIWDYSIKGGLRSTIDAFRRNPILKPKTGGAFDKFTTDPSSPYVRHRAGKVLDPELDIRRIEAAYVNSSAKVIFDRPMVQNAKLAAMALSKSALREFAISTIKNVARYDAHPELDQAWTAMTSSIMKTYARSVLGLNPVVAGYHAYRLFTDVWPAIETKYLAQGAAEFGKNPLKAMQESGRLGLIPSDVKPWSFKTLGEKGNSMLQLFSIGDYFSRSIGYQAFKAKYLAEGMAPEEATLRAITQTKNTTQLVDPIRTQRLLFGKGPEGGLIHLITQFKQQPTMIAEQWFDITKNAFNDPAAFAKLGASVIGGVAIMQLTGYKALHLSPAIWGLGKGAAVSGGLGELMDASRKFGAALGDIKDWHYAQDDYDRETYKQRAVQNIEQLVINLTKDVTPGGWSVTRQIAHGKPGFMEPTPKEPARETRPRRVEKSLKDMVFK